MDFETVRSIVRENKLFAGLDERQLGLLVMTATARGYPAGEAIYERGETANDTFALIISGLASVMRDQHEVLHSLGSGEIIGEIGIISPQHKRTLSVAAAEDTEVLEWHFEDTRARIPELHKRLKDLAWERITSWSE